MGVLLALLLLAVPIACLALLSLVAFLGVMAVAGALSTCCEVADVVGRLIPSSYRPFARGALRLAGRPGVPQL